MSYFRCGHHVAELSLNRVVSAWDADQSCESAVRFHKESISIASKRVIQGG